VGDRGGHACAEEHLWCDQGRRGGYLPAVPSKPSLPCIVLRTSRFFPEQDDDKNVREAYSDDNVKVNEYLYRRVEIEDVVTAHLLASERAPGDRLSQIHHQRDPRPSCLTTSRPCVSTHRASCGCVFPIMKPSTSAEAGKCFQASDGFMSMTARNANLAGSRDIAFKRDHRSPESGERSEKSSRADDRIEGIPCPGRFLMGPIRSDYRRRAGRAHYRCGSRSKLGMPYGI